MSATNDSVSSDSRYWKLIALLERPKGKYAWNFAIGFGGTCLGLLENRPEIFIIAALAIFIPSVIVQYSGHILECSRKQSHMERIEPVLEAILQNISFMLRNGNPEDLQLAIMLKNGDRWHPRYRFNMKEGKHSIVLPKDRAWMTDASRKAISVVRVTPELKNQLIEPEDPERFDDVSSVLVSPIYSPVDTDQQLATLVVYSNEEIAASVFGKEQNRCRQEVFRVCEREISTVLCYKHICVR